MLDPDLLAMLGLTAASLPYWWRWDPTRHPAPVLVEDVIPARTWLEDAWDVHVSRPGGLLPGSHLEDVRETLAGWEATVVCAPGGRQTYATVRMLAPNLGAALMPDGTCDVSPMPGGHHARARLTLIHSNPLLTSAPWPGPSPLLATTGIAPAGRYVDEAPAHMRFFEPGSGAVHWLVAGAQGRGKTAFLQWMLRETSQCRYVDGHGRQRSLFVTFLGDGKGGTSFPQWRTSPAMGWWAASPHNIMRMVRAAVRIADARSRRFATLRWVDAAGRERTGIDHFDPVLTCSPYLQVVIDEFPMLRKALGSKLAAELVSMVVYLAQGGRGLGVRVTICGQSISGTELGGNTDLRGMVSGNVISFKTRTREQAGMAFAGDMDGVQPADLPETLPDGVTPLQGAAYLYGPDRRSTMLRTWEPADNHEWAAAAPRAELHPGDVEAGGHDLAVWADRLAGTVPDEDPEPATAAAADGDGPDGPRNGELRTLVLAAVGKGPTKTAEVFAASKDWPEAVPASVKSIQNELSACVDDGLLDRPQRGVYVRAGRPRRRAADRQRPVGGSASSSRATA